MPRQRRDAVVRLLLLALAAATAMWFMATGSQAQQQPAPDPAAAAARLERLGSRGVRIHDPSAIVKCKDEYWLFFTGRGVQSYRSKPAHLGAGAARVRSGARVGTRSGTRESKRQ